jgi:hypothetical protein
VVAKGIHRRREAEEVFPEGILHQRELKEGRLREGEDGSPEGGRGRTRWRSGRGGGENVEKLKRRRGIRWSSVGEGGGEREEEEKKKMRRESEKG